MGAVDGCAAYPPFIRKIGMQQPVAIDTAGLDRPGLKLREVRSGGRSYQKYGWSITGHAGATVRDRFGNIYVIPVPSVSLDTNPLEKRNIIYKVNAQNGEIAEFLRLPLPKENTQNNPFGTLGLAIDCETNSLYVSTVAGSTPNKVSGSIYQISLETARVISKVEGIDAVGIAVFNFTDKKVLMYGDARSSSLYSLRLLRNGNFSKLAKPKYELSLLEIKNATSTQIKKIRFVKDDNQNHIMVLTDAEFAYRLIAETRQQSKKYYFEWNEKLGKWIN